MRERVNCYDTACRIVNSYQRGIQAGKGWKVEQAIYELFGENNSYAPRLKLLGKVQGREILSNERQKLNQLTYSGPNSQNGNQAGKEM